MKSKLFQAVVLVCLLASCLHAQNLYQPMPFIKPQFSYQNGSPVSNGWVCAFASGTTNKLDTYSTPNGSVNTDPVQLDPGGRAWIYLQLAAYTLKLYAPGIGNVCNNQVVGALIWSADNVTSVEAITGGTTNFIPKFTSSTTIGNSDISQVSLGSPGPGILLNDKVLIGATTSKTTDSAIGTLLVNGIGAFTSGTVNANTVLIGATSGGAFITSAYTGTAIFKPLYLNIFGVGTGLRITTDPFLQLDTSYTGSTVCNAFTVGFRNNAGSLESCENGGAWTHIGSGITGSGVTTYLTKWSDTGVLGSANLSENVGTGVLTVFDFLHTAPSTIGIPLQVASTYSLQTEIARFISPASTSLITTYLATSIPAGVIFNSAIVMTMQATNIAHSPTINIEANAVCGLVGSCFEFNSNGFSVIVDEDGASITETNILVSFNNDLKRVLVGAADSGGSGFRLLRITN